MKNDRENATKLRLKRSENELLITLSMLASDQIMPEGLRWRLNKQKKKKNGKLI
jgi:hypothetical protein